MTKKFIHNLDNITFAKVAINIIMLSVLSSPFILLAAGRSLDNPITPIDSVDGLINALLNIVISFGTPLAALVLVYTGYTFVTAMGNEKKLDAAKNMLWWTVIGTALVVGAHAIWTVLQSTVTAVTKS
ncbi:MAG: hypothetical protein HY225_00690 [Candidatus Vogelbacteria bacterium]|nr:hypothetical protein [Candidatus Vogelbacteria bacterium]